MGDIVDVSQIRPGLLDEAPDLALRLTGVQHSCGGFKPFGETYILCHLGEFNVLYEVVLILGRKIPFVRHAERNNLVAMLCQLPGERECVDFTAAPVIIKGVAH